MVILWAGYPFYLTIPNLSSTVSWRSFPSLSSKPSCVGRYSNTSDRNYSKASVVKMSCSMGFHSRLTSSSRIPSFEFVSGSTAVSPPAVRCPGRRSHTSSSLKVGIKIKTCSRRIDSTRCFAGICFIPLIYRFDSFIDRSERWLIISFYQPWQHFNQYTEYLRLRTIHNFLLQLGFLLYFQKLTRIALLVDLHNEVNYLCK